MSACLNCSLPVGLCICRAPVLHKKAMGQASPNAHRATQVDAQIEARRSNTIEDFLAMPDVVLQEGSAQEVDLQSFRKFSGLDEDARLSNAIKLGGYLKGNAEAILKALGAGSNQTVRAQLVQVVMNVQKIATALDLGDDVSKAADALADKLHA